MLQFCSITMKVKLLDEFSNLPIEIEDNKVSFKLCKSPSLEMEIFVALMQ